MTILYKCRGCGDLREGALNPPHAKLEVPYGGLVVDVLLFNRTHEPYFAIEIKKTHEVTPEKATAFRKHRLSWGEISAAKVIENDVLLSFDRGVFHLWKPTSAGEPCLECLDKDILRRSGGDRPHEVWAAAARSIRQGEPLPELPAEARPRGLHRRVEG